MSNLRHVTTAATVAAIAAMTQQVWAQEMRVIPGEITTLEGVVEQIDHTRRVLTVQESDGDFSTITIPTVATRFDEVKIGDAIQVRYYDYIYIVVKPANEPDVDTSSVTLTPAADAALGGTALATRTITATITALDRAMRSVTFVGAGGFNYSRRTLDSTDLDDFDVGDRIDVTWHEAVNIIVNP